MPVILPRARANGALPGLKLRTGSAPSDAANLHPASESHATLSPFWGSCPPCVQNCSPIAAATPELATAPARNKAVANHPCKGFVVSHYEGLGHHAAFYVGCISDHPTLPKQTVTSRPAAPAASGHAAATPPRLLHWHERDLRYAGSSPSSSGMWRCPRRCRHLSAPNSASTDAVRSRIALST